MEISESLDLVLGDPEQQVANRFYQNLFVHHPAAAAKFEKTDLKRQGAHLVMALQVMVRNFQRPQRAMESYLHVLGHQHFTLGVEEKDYLYFGAALMATLGAFHGQDWNAELAEQWKSAFRGAVEIMLEGYGDDFELGPAAEAGA